jgi:uncharacterized protein YcbK (DUF882 family)
MRETGLPTRARRQIAVFAAAALALAVGHSGTNAGNTRDRTISFYGINTKETLTIQYMKDGQHIPEAMQKINWMLRDWRRDEAITMDPRLIDLVWEVHKELGSAEPIHIVSGYRSRATNDMLRRTVGGQASQSRHILGQALDVHFPDVPTKKLRDSALIRERGGVGYYPTSATPFVHIDVGGVRAWPRLPRSELALLFPAGRSQHVPSDGKPITADDVRRARAAHGELAAEMAEFHAQRTQPRPPTLIAALTPPIPKLLSLPKLVERLAGSGRHPSEHDRSALGALVAADEPQLVSAPRPSTRNRPPEDARWGEMQVAALAPDTPRKAPQERTPARPAEIAAPSAREATFAPAPAFDEEHPEELSYRPFPIAPFLTITSSANDPALILMVRPDLDKTLELLGHADTAPPMRLRPGPQAASLLWAQEFKGEAINLQSLAEPEAAPRLPRRRVLTQAQ